MGTAPRTASRATIGAIVGKGERRPIEMLPTRSTWVIPVLEHSCCESFGNTWSEPLESQMSLKKWCSSGISHRDKIGIVAVQAASAMLNYRVQSMLVVSLGEARNPTKLQRQSNQPAQKISRQHPCNRKRKHRGSWDERRRVCCSKRPRENEKNQTARARSVEETTGHDWRGQARPAAPGNMSMSLVSTMNVSWSIVSLRRLASIPTRTISSYPCGTLEENPVVQVRTQAEQAKLGRKREP